MARCGFLLYNAARFWNYGQWFWTLSDLSIQFAGFVHGVCRMISAALQSPLCDRAACSVPRSIRTGDEGAAVILDAFAGLADFPAGMDAFVGVRRQGGRIGGDEANLNGHGSASGSGVRTAGI
jgi:hypothetical protein